MILFHQVRKILLNVGLVLFISIAIVFSFASGESWAATSFTQRHDQPHTQIATIDQAKVIIKNAEGKAQEALGNMTGDRQTQAAGKAKQFEAETLEGINNSIENPYYQPGGQTKQAEREDRESTEDMEAKVHEDFN